MFNYLTLGLGAAVLALAGLVMFQQRQLGATRAETKQALAAVAAEQAAHARTQATLAAREKQRAVTAQIGAADRRSVDSALVRTPDWAQQPVPEEVKHALQGDSDPGFTDNGAFGVRHWPDGSP